MTLEVNSSFLNSLILIRSYFKRVIHELIPVTPDNHIDLVRKNIESLINHLEIAINKLKQFLNHRSGGSDVENKIKATTLLNKSDFLEVLGLEMVNNNETCNTLKVLGSFGGVTSGSSNSKREVKSVWDTSLPDLNKKVDLTGEKPTLRPKPVLRSKSCLSVDKGKVPEESTLCKIHERGPKTVASNSTGFNSTVNSRTGYDSRIKGSNENCVHRENIPSGAARNSMRSYPLKYLNDWENLWEENENPFTSIKKRYNEKETNEVTPEYTVSGRIRQFERKHKRISSTVEGFLDIFDNDQGRRRRNKLQQMNTNFSSSLSSLPNTKEEEEEKVEDEEDNEDESSVTSENEDIYESSNGKGYSTDNEEEIITEAKNPKLLPVKAKSLGNLTKKNNNLRIIYDFSNGNVARSKSDRLPRIVDVVYKKKPV